MAALWGTGDTHFYHWNIGRPDYCNRPDDWQELIVERWNEVVQPEDWVLHVGDFAFGRDAKLHRIIKIRTRLNGRILLIWGNHDRIFKPRKWLEEVGIDAILRDHGESYEIGKHKIVCLYQRPERCPPAWGKRLIFASHRPIRNQAQMPYFYGHIHNNEEPEQYPGRCLCVEVTDYRPIRIAPDIEA
jgi:calcineurin-like phosphoesterase family protein